MYGLPLLAARRSAAGEEGSAHRVHGHDNPLPSARARGLVCLFARASGCVAVRVRTSHGWERQLCADAIGLDRRSTMDLRKNLTAVGAGGRACVRADGRTGQVIYRRHVCVAATPRRILPAAGVCVPLALHPALSGGLACSSFLPSPPCSSWVFFSWPPRVRSTTWRPRPELRCQWPLSLTPPPRRQAGRQALQGP